MDTEHSGAEEALPAAEREETEEEEEDKEIDAAEEGGAAATIVGATVDVEESAGEGAGAVAAAEVGECAGGAGESFCVCARGLADARTAGFRDAVGSEKRGCRLPWKCAVLECMRFFKKDI